MKGVINQGMQELVETRFGAAAWEAICADAGCDEPMFSATLNYPDQMTVDLIAATARRLRVPATDVMVEFGRFWISNTGKRTYPSLFAMGGNNARSFLRHIDRVHRQITTSLPGAHPPRFRVDDQPDGELILHYQSERMLCPVVRGLILGVGNHFQEELQITSLRCMHNGDEECVLAVTFQQ